MSIRNPVIGAVAIVCALAAAAPAAAQERLVHDFDRVTLQTLLTEFGFDWSYVDGMEGVIRIGYGDNVILLEGQACGDDGFNCRGLQIAGVYPATRTTDQLNAFNQTTLFANAVHQGETIVVSRYLIADHGFSVPSLKQNIEIFSAVLDNFASFEG